MCSWKLYPLILSAQCLCVYHRHLPRCGYVHFFFTPRWNSLSHVSKEEEEGKVSNFLQSVVIDKKKRKRKSENLSEFFPLHFLYPRRVAAGHQMMTSPRSKTLHQNSHILIDVYYISTCVFGRERERGNVRLYSSWKVAKMRKKGKRNGIMLF